MTKSDSNSQDSADTPPLLGRSRLYCMSPVGIGTPVVESHTSYLVRLAEAHCVSVKTLLVREVLPAFGRNYLRHSQENILTSFWSNNAPSLNGILEWAQDSVRVIGSLTLRDDLRFTTMLSWAGVLPTRGLIRRTRAWCPLCYDEQRRQNRIVYDPLLWGLEAVSVCLVHHSPLSTCCVR
jgi:hypothetical protein